MNADNIEQPDIYSVSQLNSEARDMLEGAFTNIWVEGEISNFVRPNSGHWYFSLKDSQAQIRCAMFRGNQRKLDFQPKDGMFVLLRARVSLYEARGDFQLIADFMEERGEGKLRRAYEALKKKLAADGLFDEEHKFELPQFPEKIGVITSATGAAIRDILHVLKRRAPGIPIVIYPSLVQGETAAKSLIKAIQKANSRHECDVLILARGGGSLEDLWPFNDEALAHAIYKSKIPIVTGIGHEVDFTIADFVADLRAPTPSAAAEIITSDQKELILQLARSWQQLCRLAVNAIKNMKQQLVWTEKHLKQQHPKRRLAEKMQQLDYCDMRLTHLMQNILKQKQHQMAQLATKLDMISPLATLKRGYAIVNDMNNHVVHDIKQVNTGDEISIKLEKGKLGCLIKSKEK